ncbi:MAG: hypothetical protein ACE5HV_03460 [Acidobacteriota bacterium]
MIIEEDAASGSGGPSPQGTVSSSDAQAKTAPTPAADGEAEGLRLAPDPHTCRAIAICLPHFEQSVLEGEWDATDFRYYLEPAGVGQARLRCQHCPAEGGDRAGLLMTRAGWKAHAVFLSDDLNPERYDLSFPKEFGYVKTLSHYQPASREHAFYPWSKKY